MNRATIILLVTILFLVSACSKQNPVPPILILATDSNFGTYTGEIMKAEGFNEFEIDSVNGRKMSKAFLAPYDLIIIAEDITDPHDWHLLSEYVKRGGKLIAVRPVESHEELFGIAGIGGSINGGYITIDTSEREGRSLSGRKLQLHTEARLSELKGAKPVAFLTEGLVNEKKYPAVVTHHFGKGKTAAFLYNLPENIVYTRQGNPQFAGLEKDSIPGLRAMDLFTDGWVDTSNNIINQADEQMRLLSRCIGYMNTDTKPLPRFWYFPDTLKCLVTLTNDGEYRQEKDFEPQFREVDSMKAKMTIYIIDLTKVTKAWVEKWTSKGFEIAGHPDDTREAADPQWTNMNNVLSDKMKELKDLYGLKMNTVVNHWFVWCGTDSEGRPEFAAQAEIEAGHNLSMESNYAHYDNHSGQGHFLGSLGLDQGNFTGSGLPMKFAGSKGKIFGIYQQLNNVYDQEYNENHDPEGYFNCFKGLVDRSIYDQVYTYVSIKSHNDEYYFSRVPLLKMLAYARNNNIPVWTLAQLSDFIKMKDEAIFSSVDWSDNELKFNLISSVINKNGLTFMIPFRYNELEVSVITVDGKVVPLNVKTVRGSDYAFCTVKPGSNYSILARYGK